MGVLHLFRCFLGNPPLPGIIGFQYFYLLPSTLFTAARHGSRAQFAILQSCRWLLEVRMVAPERSFSTDPYYPHFWFLLDSNVWIDGLGSMFVRHLGAASRSQPARDQSGRYRHRLVLDVRRSGGSQAVACVGVSRGAICASDLDHF